MGQGQTIVNVILKQSHLWTHVKIMKLTTNMRAHLSNDTAAADFAHLLLDIGEGRLTLAAEPDTINIPPTLGKWVVRLEKLKVEVYQNLAANYNRPEWLAERAIVSPLNTNVNHLNTWLMNEFPGEDKQYKSVDSAMSDEEAVTYPVEFLNSLELTCMPPHLLKLKVGSPIMVLRSPEPPNTTNGTRCTVIRLHENVIEATISCGPYKGQVVLSPRIPLMPSDAELPFQFRRLQFPIKPCFAMTVNKSQGQTFKAIGVDLHASCFFHGMFYVAASHTGNSANLSLMAPNNQ
uniref:ATP-dependent DNA helicase n=1 Tax=Eptatretus burgeri TaxID=7764 RepID=A0A8C4NFJ6_EPTBU